MDIKMGNLGSIILVAAAFAITIVLQMTVSKMRWTFGGLILPMLVFVLSVILLIQNLHNIRDGIAVVDTLTAFLHFALYNIPTILFLCIYNYYQRMRFMRKERTQDQ